MADDRPIAVPFDVASEVDARLLDRRIVVVSGELDLERATRLAAALMTLDATGDDDVELRLLSCTGSIEHSLSVIDVIDVLGVQVNTVGIGAIDGGAVGLLASGAHRRVSPNARLALRAPDVTVQGTAGDLERALAESEARRLCFLERIARAARRPLDEVAAEWERSSYLVANDAVTLGYADRVEGELRLAPS